ncbi:MAG: hypothetical protein WA865_07910, partial [Spirulinaceae cyanobacterium]
MAIEWKIPEIRSPSSFQGFLFLRLPRTIPSKGFRVLGLFFMVGYDNLIEVPRKCTLKTKY